jgi:hypothetical protein
MRSPIFDAMATYSQARDRHDNGLPRGGCELAMSCDMRIAREAVWPAEIKLGLIPGAAAQRLPAWSAWGTPCA